MHIARSRLTALSAALALQLSVFTAPSPAGADVVTDWDELTVLATKGFDGSTGTGLTLNSNLASRVEAITARAAFDAINAVLHFSPRSYYYRGSHGGSAEAAGAQAVHDALLALLPNPAVDTAADPRWTRTRTWLDAELSATLAALSVAADDAGLAAGKAAAAAAVAARRLDNASAASTYGAQLTPSENPGAGLWRQSNAAPGVIDASTGAPTGFDASGAILGRPGIDYQWRDVTPFALGVGQKNRLVAAVPEALDVRSEEARAELAYIREIGGSSSTRRSPDQTAQALYYRQDAEIFVHEVARIASEARGLTLSQNAALFALLASAVADARIAAFASKYDQRWWRPVTAINADADGAVASYAWRPLSATPAHPSNTSGHSATGAAGLEVLRAALGSDSILPGGQPVELGSLPFLAGTNSGTGNVPHRTVRTFSDVQLENGASRLYLGVHFGWDNLQGQLLGTAVVKTILDGGRDPAARVLGARAPVASALRLVRTLSSRPDVYGLFGKRPHAD